MAGWKIHASWAVVVVVVAGAWGRWCGRSRESGTSMAEFRATPKVAGGASRPRPSGPPDLAGAPKAPARRPDPAPEDPDVTPPYTYVYLTLDQIRALMRSETREDLLQACVAIHHLADHALKTSLLLELLGSKNEEIRLNCLGDLRMTAGKDAVPALREAARADPSARIRRSCVEALGDLGGEGTVEALLGAVRDEDEGVRLSAAGTLSRLGHPGPAADLIAPLASQLDDPDGAVRRRAAEGLSSLHTPLALPGLLRAVRDPSGEVRAAAARGLGAVGGSGVLPVLEGLIGDPVPDVADAAKDALETLGAPKK